MAISTYSKAAQNSVEDKFFLKMRQSQCVDNLLAFDPSGSRVHANGYGTSVVSDVNYKIGDSAVNIDPKYSTKMDTTTCPLTA